MELLVKASQITGKLLGKNLKRIAACSRLKVLTDPRRAVIINVRMLKWVTSLLLFFALTGQVWAGACGCFDSHSDSHSCCKPDKSGKDSLAAPPCCPRDCESVTGSQMPGKNSDRVSPVSQVELVSSEARTAFWPARHIITARAFAWSARLEQRLKLARPPDALYLRHNSFLI
ncbi:MAG: hypothetical protein AB7V18_17610 [Pyrinomonadaceae bacterium]